MFGPLSSKNPRCAPDAFVRERAIITMTLISSCHWKTLVPFGLQMKRMENSFLKPTENCRKVIQKNNLYYPK